MSVIERAEQKLQEEIRKNHLGADNWHNLRYWAAYLDGARAQHGEMMQTRNDELNAAYLQGYDAADQKRGEWVYNDGDYIPYCSICGMPQDTETPYCHFCGANMEVPKRD